MKKLPIWICVLATTGLLWLAQHEAIQAAQYKAELFSLRDKAAGIDYRCDICGHPVFQFDSENLSEACRKHSH